ETSQGKTSRLSNFASITPVEVPGSVSGLAAVADQRRIFLQWKPPEDHPELADVYLVARSDLPAGTETVMETKYEDPRYTPGKTLMYQVTPARRVGERL